MANLDPMFLGSYESISKHMETYEQNLVQKEGEIKQHLKNYCLLDKQFQH